MIALGAILSGVGHYDGVVGTAQAQEFLTPQAPREATVRVLVVGTPQDSQSAFELYHQELLLPAPMSRDMQGAQYVPVRLLGDEPDPIDCFLRVASDGAPEPGRVLVAHATVETYWPLRNSPSGQERGVPVLFLEADDYHEPILFKN